MDYDRLDKFDPQTYRHFQGLIPGVDAFYELVASTIETKQPDRSAVLVIGAGAGREIEGLGSSVKKFQITAIDPSERMLDIATTYAEQSKNADAITLIKAKVGDLPLDTVYDAATCLLVTHFYGKAAKLGILKQIQRRLKPNALFVYADVCFEDKAQLDDMRPAFFDLGIKKGFDADIIADSFNTIQSMPIISEAETYKLLDDAGFEGVTPFFRSLWYSGWWMRRP